MGNYKEIKIQPYERKNKVMKEIKRGDKKLVPENQIRVGLCFSLV